MSESSPVYQLWRRGNGRTNRPEAWQTVTQLQALEEIKLAFAHNFGKLAKRHPGCAIDAASVWWCYLNQRFETIDLGRIRIRRRDGDDGQQAEQARAN